MTEARTPPPTRGVPVELDRTRYLRYTLATMRTIREEFGKELAAGISDDKLAKVLWYGLRGEDPTVTIEQVEEAIDLENLSTVMDAMRKAMGQKARVERIAGPPEPAPAPAEQDRAGREL